MCSELVRAFNTSPLQRSLSRPTPSVDGREEHRVIVVDLAVGGHGDRGVVAPVPLTRILQAVHLLPPWAHGGIVIRNAVIEGTLLLNNLHLAVPLAFANVQFIGGGYRKNVYKIDREVEAAISILHSRFEDHILIAASEICGDVLISNSQFEEKFEWEDVHQTASDPVNGSADSFGFGCVDNRQMASPSGLYIYSSSFRQSLRINRTSLGKLDASSNRMGRFLSWQSRFGDELSLTDNDIGSVNISSHLAAKTVLSYNRIRNDFFLSGHDVIEGDVKSIEINSNRIGGGIGFTNFPPGVLPETISLESNHVGNGSLLCLPSEWTGTLSLDGGAYDGKLAIGLTRNLSEERDSEGRDGALERDDSEALQCSWRSWEPKRFLENKNENAYCDDLKPLTFSSRKETTARELGVVKVDLKAVEVRTLNWQLPLTCRYRWSGYGLDYRLWQPAENAPTILSEHTGRWDLSPLRAFQAWRTTLWGHDPAPLDTMSSYLAENGAYNESRTILLEAKRLNYAPSCKPSENAFYCAYVVVFDALLPSFWSWAKSPLSPQDASATEDPKQQQSNSNSTSAGTDDLGSRPVWSHIRSASMLFILWPGGYGAAPERAVGLIFVATVFFFIVYRAYAWFMKRSVLLVPDQIDILARALLLPWIIVKHRCHRETQSHRSTRSRHSGGRRHHDGQHWILINSWTSFATT